MMRKLTGWLAVAAAVAVALPAQAAPVLPLSPLDAVFNVTVWSGTGDGKPTDPIEQALPGNPLASGTPVATFAYTGPLNWLTDSGSNPLSGFVGNGGGVVSGCAGADCLTPTALNGATLSTSGYGLTTLFELTFFSSAPLGSITNDDGASLYLDGTNVFSDPAPTSADDHVLTGAGSGYYDLWYVEANGAPSQLTLEAVPEPAGMAMLGAGLLTLALARKKRR